MAELLALTQSLLLQAGLVFLRIGPVAVLLPAFGEQSVPARVRLAIGLAFTAIVAPAAPVLMSNTPNLVQFALAETTIGLTLGVGIRLFILGLQTAGSIAAQATSLAQIFGGAAGEPMPAIGHVLVIAGLALAVMSGLHVRAAELMIGSYRVFAPGQFPLGADLAAWGTARIASVFTLAFRLAAPFVILSVIYNLTLGVINRAMPQLMVAFVGAPVITAGGLTFLFLLAPLMLSVWHNAFTTFLSNPLGSPR